MRAAFLCAMSALGMCTAGSANAQSTKLLGDYAFTGTSTCLATPPAGGHLLVSSSVEGVRSFDGDGNGTVRGTSVSASTSPTSSPALDAATGTSVESFSYRFTYSVNSDETFTVLGIPGTWRASVVSGPRSGQSYTMDMPRMTGLIADGGRTLTLATISASTEAPAYSNGDVWPQSCHRTRVLARITPVLPSDQQVDGGHRGAPSLRQGKQAMAAPLPGVQGAAVRRTVNGSLASPSATSVPLTTISADTATFTTTTTDTLNVLGSMTAPALTMVDQIVGGHMTTSAVDISTTWNTTNRPTAFKLNVTDIASNGGYLFDVRVGGKTRFNVDKSGVMTISNSTGSSYGGIALAGSQGEIGLFSLVHAQGGRGDVLRYYWENGLPGNASVISGTGSNRLSIESQGAIVHIARNSRYEWEGWGSPTIDFMGYEAASSIGKSINITNIGQSSVVTPLYVTTVTQGVDLMQLRHNSTILARFNGLGQLTAPGLTVTGGTTLNTATITSATITSATADSVTTSNFCMGSRCITPAQFDALLTSAGL